MQTRAELYATIRYHDYEALDASIVTTVPAAPEQRHSLTPVADSIVLPSPGAQPAFT